jgi:rod shape-determining protein MreC
MAANADIKPGDVLTTSGVDGVYPTGIAGGQDRPHRTPRRFGLCPHLLRAAWPGDGARHVMVLKPMLEPDARAGRRAPNAAPPVAEAARR